jgi:hypothetical protein
MESSEMLRQFRHPVLLLRTLHETAAGGLLTGNGSGLTGSATFGISSGASDSSMRGW